MKRSSCIICSLLVASTGVAAVAAPITVNQITSSITSHNLSDAKSNIPSSIATSFAPRVLINQDHPFPVYPTPMARQDSSAVQQYTTPFMSHDLAPDYVAMWKLYDIMPDSEHFPNNWIHGWPQDYEKLTYHQFFLNSNVATKFDTWANHDDDPSHTVNIDQDYLNIYNLVDGIYNKFVDMDANQYFDLNLSGDYKYDDYADENIKVLNNPFFYEETIFPAVTDGYSFWSLVGNINLSNNDLWYIPFFGYWDVDPNFYSLIYSYSELYVYRSYHLVSASEYIEGLSHLKFINLSNNHLTTLPITYYYRDMSEGTDEEVREWGDDDLTCIMYDTNSESVVGEINVNGNYLRNTFDLGTFSSFVANKNPVYEHSDAISSALPNSLSSTTATNDYQTTAIYWDENMYKKALNYYVYNAVDQEGLPIHQTFDDVDLNKYNPQIISVIPDLYNYGNSKNFNIGQCINSLIVDYINDNWLSSNVVYDDILNQELLISNILGGNCFFAYSNFSSNTGKTNLAINVMGPQQCTWDGINYHITTYNSDISYFFGLSLSHFKHLNVMWIIEGIIIGLVAIALIMLILYCVVFRKKMAKKRKDKDLTFIHSVLKK